MEVVFDASTLILLAKITLLRTVTEKITIMIPEAVKQESLKKKELFDAQIINELINENKIACRDVRTPKDIAENFSLDKGEAEALYIAKVKDLPLATDDKPTIKACKILNVHFLTAIHFLIYCYKKGSLTNLIALEKLRMLEKYGRYSSDIIKNAKDLLEGE